MAITVGLFEIYCISFAILFVINGFCILKNISTGETESFTPKKTLVMILISVSS